MSPKNCPEGTIAIAHDDDLQLVEHGVRLQVQDKSSDFNVRMRTVMHFFQEILTANAAKQFLRENKFPVLVENGGKYSAPILRKARGAEC